jgi:hypothetical protein
MREVLATGRSGRGRVQQGQVSIEQTFYAPATKHGRPIARPTAVHAPLHLHRPLRPVALTALRTALAVGLAMLLILVLLPALIAAQAAMI